MAHTLNAISFDNIARDSGPYVFIQKRSEREFPTIDEIFSCLLNQEGSTTSVNSTENQKSARLLNKYKNLPSNWDSYGALSIPDKVISNANYLLELMPETGIAPDIYPNPNGTISLEWESRQVNAHLEVGETEYSLYIKYRSGAKIYGYGEVEYLTQEQVFLIAHAIMNTPQEAPTISDIRLTT